MMVQDTVDQYKVLQRWLHSLLWLDETVHSFQCKFCEGWVEKPMTALKIRHASDCTVRQTYLIIKDRMPLVMELDPY